MGAVRQNLANYWANFSTGHSANSIGYVHGGTHVPGQGFRGGAANILYLDGHAAPLTDPGSGYPDIARHPDHVNAFWH